MVALLPCCHVGSASSLRHRRTADLSPTEVVTRLARGYKTDTPELSSASSCCVQVVCPSASLPACLSVCLPLWLIRCTCFQVQFEATRRLPICIMHGKTRGKTCAKQAQLLVTASSILAAASRHTSSLSPFSSSRAFHVLFTEAKIVFIVNIIIGIATTTETHLATDWPINVQHMVRGTLGAALASGKPP